MHAREHVSTQTPERHQKDGPFLLRTLSGGLTTGPLLPTPAAPPAVDKARTRDRDRRRSVAAEQAEQAS